MNRIIAFVILMVLLLFSTDATGSKAIIANGSSNADYARIHEPISSTESRYVWEEGMEPILDLTPLNSDILYYDIDSGAGGEIMSIDIGDPAQRTIELNKLTYKTSAFNISFKCRQFGNYSAIGFLGEKYLAAYTNDSKIAEKPVNLLSRKILSKILIDDNTNHSLTEGKKLALGNEVPGGDYVLLATNINTTSGTAVISIHRKGIQVYHKIVIPGYTVIYERAVDKVYTVSGIESYLYFPASLPEIAVHVNSISTENGNATVVIDGIFQLSDVYTDIDPEYGLLGITEVSDKGITMKNRMKANLSISDNMDFVNAQGTYISPIYFIGYRRLKLANSRTLRFFVYDENMPGNHERRGSVYSKSSPVLAWDGLNFPGFWYNIDSNSFSEKLGIINISGREIPRGYLRYNITGVRSPFEVAGINGSEKYGLNASFMVFGIGTEKYVAVNGNSTELSKILIEHTSGRYDKKTLVADEIWELGAGYNLTIKSVDAINYTRKALLSLSHNGTVLKEGWIPAGGFFSYSENVSSDEINIPKFFTYLESVFSGEPDLAQLRYTFLRSDNITRIQKGDRIGVFKVTDVEPGFISMENDIDIYLRPGSHLNLIGNLSFRVADANELRFCPSNTKGQEISEENKESSEVQNSINQSANSSETQSRYDEPKKVTGFEAILAITIFLTVYIAGRKIR
jgi:S-layer protein (TIGR01567 family)